MTRFKTLLASFLISTFALSSAAFADSPKRETRTHKEMTPREKNRVKEALETNRAKERAAAARREEMRREAMKKDLAAWKRARDARAEAHRKEIYAKWYAAVSTPQGRAEFELYGDRMARLNRIKDIARERRDEVMLRRADRVVELENHRHANVITIIIAGL